MNDQDTTEPSTPACAASRAESANSTGGLGGDYYCPCGELAYKEHACPVTYKATTQALDEVTAENERLKGELNALDKALRCEGWPIEARVARANMLSDLGTSMGHEPPNVELTGGPHGPDKEHK